MAETTQTTELLYPHDAQMPPAKAALAGLQQVIAMFVGCMTPALIFISAVEVDAATQSYLISMSLLTAGIGTFLQARRFGPIGSGLLSVNGTSFAYLDLLIRAGNDGGIALACGMALAAVPLQFALGFCLPYLRQVISPLVAGIVVLLIGLNLIPVAGYYVATIADPDGFWLPNGIIVLTVILILIFTQFSRAIFLRVGGPVLAILIGYLVSAGFGFLKMPNFAEASWFVLPQPFREGLAFKWEYLLPFAVIYVVSSIETIGDISATAALSGLKTHGQAFWNRLRGGIFSDAIATTLAACLSAFPTSSFSQNNGVIQLTGVGSRQVGYYVAGILIVCGLFPITGQLFIVMPKPVLGGVTLVLFGMIAGAGLRMINQYQLGNHEILMIAVSLGCAFAIPSQEDFVKLMPDLLQGVLSSPVATGGLVAILFSLLCVNDLDERLRTDT